jgi:serine/threonine protein kinase
MGCFCGKEDSAGTSGSANKSNKSNSKKAPPAVVEPEIPEFGLGSAFKVKKWLGAGGTGETFLCTDARTTEEVAIKFIQRPLPKALMPMIKAEIEVRCMHGTEINAVVMVSPITPFKLFDNRTAKKRVILQANRCL